MPVVRVHEGKNLKVLTDAVQVKVPSSSSIYQMSVVVVEVPPGSKLPPSSHTKEEEVYYVLHGSLDLVLEDRVHRMLPGDLAHIPPGVAHGYENTSSIPVRFLAWSVGGPIDEFFQELANDVKSMPDDAEKLFGAMARYGIVSAS